MHRRRQINTNFLPMTEVFLGNSMSKTPVRLTIILSLVLTTASCSVRTPSLEKQSQYVAGLFLLSSADGAFPEKTIRQYRELTALTGIDAAAATRLLDAYRENPAQWQKVHAGVSALLTEARKQSAPAAPESAANKPLPPQGRQAHAAIYR
jgi:hypothetical protein